MKQSQQLVVYKDSHSSQTMYFGPFVDIRFASEFSDSLPTPLKGGFKRYAITQPFTAGDGKVVSDLIMIHRDHSLIHAITEDMKRAQQ